MGYIEDVIGAGVAEVTGDPTITGLVFIGFFFAFVMLQGTRFEGKIVVLLPVFFLSLIFLPILLVFAIIAAAFIAYIAVMRAVNK